jgi:outer membrane protein OmpA-like peptidoglycan-associated protein
MSAVAAPSHLPSAQAQGPSAVSTPPPCPFEASAPPGVLAWVSGCAILLAKGIIFDIEKATLKRESFPTLDAVAAILHREAALRVEIRGHINAQSERTYSRRLSEQRAESVMRYLVEQGIARERLFAKGYEGDVPLVDPKTEEGRIKNRRIEFIIVRQ